MLTTTSRDHGTTQESITELKRLVEGTKQDLNDQVEQVEDAIHGAAESFRDRLQADCAQLQSALQALAQAQHVADTTRPQVVIEKNQGGEDSRALFGTDVSQPHFDLTVSNNIADKRAVIVTGVNSTETVQAFLKGSGRSDVALIMQTMQSPLHGSDKDKPESDLSRIVAQQPTLGGGRLSMQHDPSQVSVSQGREAVSGCSGY